jgi:hypothetical protein
MTPLRGLIMQMVDELAALRRRGLAGTPSHLRAWQAELGRIAVRVGRVERAWEEMLAEAAEEERAWQETLDLAAEEERRQARHCDPPEPCPSRLH